MSIHYDYTDYHSIAEDAEELYSSDYDYDYNDHDKSDWENYYHNIADEIAED